MTAERVIDLHPEVEQIIGCSDMLASSFFLFSFFLFFKFFSFLLEMVIYFFV